ncbi:MAG: signal peptidase I [Eubacteriaceae bacterium]|jgi:signal peptidase I
MELQQRPTSEQVREELNRENYHAEYRKTLRRVLLVILAVAAAAVLIAMLWLPVLQMSGTSMEPTLEPGQIVVAVKNGEFEQGDLIAFYYNNKILVKRVIAVAGDYVDIKDDGTVYVNEQKLDEPYLTEKSFGQVDITLPYQVPDGKIFVMGDHRATSLDSRSSSIGSIGDEYVVGKIIFRLWPFNGFGPLSS